VDKLLDTKLRGLLPKGEYSRRQDQARIRLEEAMGGGRSLVLPVYYMGISGIQPGDFSHLHFFENRSDPLPNLGEPTRGIYNGGGGGSDAVSKEIKRKFSRGWPSLCDFAWRPRACMAGALGGADCLFSHAALSRPVGFLAPRYKALIQRVISGNRLFLYSKGPPRLGGIATIVLVTRCSILTGGKADVICRGVEKVTLSEVWPDREIPGMLTARCVSSVAAPLADMVVDPDGEAGVPAPLANARPVPEDLVSLVSVEGWLTQGREGELIDLPVIARPAGSLPLAIGDRVKINLQEQRFRVVAQRLLSSPQLCLIGEEPPVSGQVREHSLLGFGV
jgi:hypothetical protein